MALDRISIELTNRCRKGCWFCYNSSNPHGDTSWQLSEVLSFVGSCAEGGVRAVSFGGGEPLEYNKWRQVFAELKGIVFRSMTTNGILLQDKQKYADLLSVRPDKVHVSIHFPERLEEVERVVGLVNSLYRDGIRSGINLLVAKSSLSTAIQAAKYIRDSGIDNERIVYLPMRGRHTPTAQEISLVAGGICFQSMSCLSQCARSPRFCSISWDKTVAWCSYTTSRRALSELTYQGLIKTIHNLQLRYCGDEQIYSIA